MSKKEYQQKFVIGNTDYTREQLSKGVYGWGASSKQFLDRIVTFENEGFSVKFETSLLRKLFGVGKYRVVGYR
jgi:hypothetical protein